MHKKYIVVAIDKNRGMGKDGSIPWHFRNEIKFFKEITTKTTDPTKQNMVIMGRTTWDSLPYKFRPLPGRKNVVLSRDPDYQTEGATVAHSLQQAIDLADDTIEDIHIIGGSKVYESSFEEVELDGLYITEIEHEFDCDTFLPMQPEKYSKKTLLKQETEGDIVFNYNLYTP